MKEQVPLATRAHLGVVRVAIRANRSLTMMAVALIDTARPCIFVDMKAHIALFTLLHPLCWALLGINRSSIGAHTIQNHALLGVVIHGVPGVAFTAHGRLVLRALCACGCEARGATALVHAAILRGRNKMAPENAGCAMLLLVRRARAPSGLNTAMANADVLLA